MITHTIKNPLLHRDELMFQMESSGTPSIAQAGQAVADAAKSTIDHVVVKSVRGHYGAGQFSVEAFVYTTPEHKVKIERKPKEKKGAAS